VKGCCPSLMQVVSLHVLEGTEEYQENPSHDRQCSAEVRTSQKVCQMHPPEMDTVQHNPPIGHCRACLHVSSFMYVHVENWNRSDAVKKVRSRARPSLTCHCGLPRQPRRHRTEAYVAGITCLYRLLLMGHCATSQRVAGSMRSLDFFQVT
jgi:hypothetical protein